MKYLLLLVAPIALAACSDNKTAGESAVVSTKDSVATPSAAAEPVNRHYLLGSFVGPFGRNKISFLITRAEGDSVHGRTVVGGNDRPFAGTVTEENGQFHIQAVEPGGDAHDGKFDVVLDSSTKTVQGSWAAFDRKLEPKTFKLTRRVFQYNPSVGSFPEASQRVLTAEDVENFMKSDLEHMRNEIFARHGYCFKKRHLRETFEELDWYVPDNVDIRDRLTAIEKKNLALIERYAKYADDYGDEYGR